MSPDAATAPAARETGSSPRFDNSYARLPERFHVRMAPDPVRAPALIRLNEALARELGFEPEARTPDDWARVFGGNAVLEGSEPLAQAYAGHQFGNFVPQLGDGRALLLGEVIDTAGRRRDIQLKGSGRTPFSRMGDGRSALGPVLREYVVSEAMHALGIPTTRALAAVTTGERVVREDLMPGGVLARVAASHVRVGTFQYFAARGDTEAVRTLADHAIQRHDPDLAGDEAPYLGLLARVAERQARLVARWMGVGFIHGVMNTDNMALSGETIDYGPCAFMEAYDPAQVFSFIDQFGRYAFANQPRIAQWNLARFAETLLSLLADDEETAIERASEVVTAFAGRFEEAWHSELRRKLGLAEAREGDVELAERLLGRMQAVGADFTLTFRALAGAAVPEAGAAALGDALAGDAETGAWLAEWRARLEAEGATPETAAARLKAANPRFIPRNHRVEEAIAAAVTEGDLAPFLRLVEVTGQPHDEQPEAEDLARPAAPAERVTTTFCGT